LFARIHQDDIPVILQPRKDRRAYAPSHLARSFSGSRVRRGRGF